MTSGARGARTVAIVHVPSPALEQGERTHIERTAIDVPLAVRQHDGYRAMLEECGAAVVVLDVNRSLADSVFVEDTAIVLDDIAIVTSMGAASRRPETEGIANELARYRPMERISLPATIEGGDVVRVGRTILVGISSRTNAEGVEALRGVVEPLGYRVRAIEMSAALHFKSACTALPDGRLLVNREWIPARTLDDFDLVAVPPEDPWGANVAIVNECVCAATEHAPTNEMLSALGYDVRSTPLSEFAKAEGAVTCMSLVFRVAAGES